ncbi:MAG: hypothetical protein ROR55_09455 [Devosia sp.]
MKLGLRLVFETTKEANARRVLNRLHKLIDPAPTTFSRDGEGRMVATQTRDAAPLWESAVVSSILLAQSFGNGWCLTGWLEEELRMTATQFQVPGLVFADLTLFREPPPAAGEGVIEFH